MHVVQYHGYGGGPAGLKVIYFHSCCCFFFFLQLPFIFVIWVFPNLLQISSLLIFWA
jgi:hypothetical protein